VKAAKENRNVQYEKRKVARMTLCISLRQCDNSRCRPARQGIFLESALEKPGERRLERLVRLMLTEGITEATFGDRRSLADRAAMALFRGSHLWET